jgi:glycosyltransferase involved in cell wall biosynthesis
VIAGRLFRKKTLVKIANSGQYSDISRMRENYLLWGQQKMLTSTLNADRIIAVNNQIIHELKEAGVSSNRIALIPNGVEQDETIRKTDYGLNDPVTVIFTGRLHPQKALDVLIRAFKHAIDVCSDLDWQLSIIGEGPLRLELEDLTAQLGIAPIVKFRGPIHNVSDHLSKADIFALPSWAEGMSNAMLEAMALGLPCVASNIGANKDLIEHGEQGLLVVPGDANDLAKAIIGLAGDEKLRRKLGTLGFQAIQAKYNIDKVARQYLANYQELLKM